jgi:23S rRNA pseudouridine1911/1915/1917 synthase
MNEPSEFLPLEFIINDYPAYEGERTDKWITRVSDLSRNQVQNLIESKKISLDEHPLESVSLSVQKLLELYPQAQKLIITMDAAQPTEILPEKISLDILFEDEHLIVINKPQGMSVHPSTTESHGTLVNALLYHLPNLKGIGGEIRPGIVHRIDKYTSGVIVVAKTQEALQKLVHTFSEHDIERTYWAICYGSLQRAVDKKFTLTTLIGRNPQDRKKMAIISEQSKHLAGKKAITHFKVLESYLIKNNPIPFASLIEAKLETGRTHQIRVHLTSLSHSIMGDPVYGTPTSQQYKWTTLPPDVQTQAQQLPGQALHARSLGFLHPITGEHLSFTGDCPKVFEDLLSTLRHYKN